MNNPPANAHGLFAEAIELPGGDARARFLAARGSPSSMRRRMTVSSLTRETLPGCANGKKRRMLPPDKSGPTQHHANRRGDLVTGNRPEHLRRLPPEFVDEAKQTVADEVEMKMLAGQNVVRFM